jgi:hypothetical protein
MIINNTNEENDEIDNADSNDVQLFDPEPAPEETDTFEHFTVIFELF